MNAIQEFNDLTELANTHCQKGDYLTAAGLYLSAYKSAIKISHNALDEVTKMQFKKSADACLNMHNQCNIAHERNTALRNGGNRPMGNAGNLKQNIVADNRITFKDVAGLDDVKDLIVKKVINPLKYPDRAALYHCNPGAMIMLYGLPGTGKTMMARAIAGELDIPFYEIGCHDLISMYVGESGQRLQAIFDAVLKNEKAMMFFDEFDAVASKRSDNTDGADQEINRFMATFLTNISNARNSKTNKMLVIVTATNKPWSIDSAMLRGERIDESIYVPLPDEKAVKAMISKDIGNIPGAPNYSIDEFARLIVKKGFGGGDVMAICKSIRSNLLERDIRTNVRQKIKREDYVNEIARRNVCYDRAEYDKFQEFVHRGGN